MEPLNLSRELLQNLVRVLHGHDERCQADAMLAAQYLAAVVGLLVGNTDRPADEKKEIMKQINAFSEYVLNDVISQARPAPPPADPAKAFGIWKPPSA